MIDYSRALKAVERDIDPIEKSFAEFQQQIADPSLKSTLNETTKQARDLVEEQLESLKMLEKLELSGYLRKAMDEKTVSAEEPATTQPIAPAA